MLNSAENHKNRKNLLAKLNTRLMKLKSKDCEPSVKTRNSPLLKPHTFVPQANGIRTLQPSPIGSQNNSPKVSQSKLPPLPQNSNFQKLTSFVSHRKQSFASVMKWDHQKRRNVATKIWLKPESSLSGIQYKAVKKTEGSQVMMLTLGRTPKPAHVRSHSDVHGKYPTSKPHLS